MRRATRLDPLTAPCCEREPKRVAANGSGTLTVAGVNAYTGVSRIHAGILTLNGSDRISDLGALVLAGGTFALTGFSETLGPLSLR
jgi:autotransporter-associated beta strand protein